MDCQLPKSPLPATLNMLADLCSRIVQSSEVQGCSLGRRTYLGDMGQKRHPGDGSYEFTSSKGLIGPDEVLHHEKEVLHPDTKMPNENLDEEKGKDHDAQNAGDIEDDDIFSDIDGYGDERTDIATKKNAFLSSRCTYTQGSLATIDWEELNVCVKCNKGGKLLHCSTKSCLVVIHESCLGSDASFSLGEEFYCPFCAYSQVISKYMEIKKKTSLAKKEFAAFVCWGTRKESKKQHHGSSKIKQLHFEQDDGLHEGNELNKDIAKNMNNHLGRRKLECEQAILSILSSVDNPSFEGKTANSINGTHHTPNDDNQETKNSGQMSQCPKVHGRDQMAALATLKTQGENACCQIRKKRNGSESHGENRSKKRVLCSPETALPREYKFSPHTESADDQEISEEKDENNGTSKYFIRVKKHRMQYSFPALHQLKRKRLPWTTAEEEKLKEGMRRFCSPNDRFIPWKKIQEFGAAVFHESRSTIDLKDKWRNLCKASPKS